MANKTPQEKLEEQQKLKELSPYSLPDNPSQKGWSAGQIKSKLYKGLFYLYSLLDESRTKVGDVEQTLDDLNLDDFVTEDEAEQIKNSTTYLGEETPDNNPIVWLDTNALDDDLELETQDLQDVLQFFRSNNLNLSFGDEGTPQQDVLEFDESTNTLLQFDESDNDTLEFENQYNELQFE